MVKRKTHKHNFRLTCESFVAVCGIKPFCVKTKCALERYCKIDAQAIARSADFGDFLSKHRLMYNIAAVIRIFTQLYNANKAVQYTLFDLSLLHCTVYVRPIFYQRMN